MMMKNVAIATDSHSSITPEMAQTLGVAVLPMPFTIDGTCYLEEETLTRAEFYAHQRRGAKIATSQPAPADVTALWDNLLTDHDEVVYIPISSGLSGSCQAAMALARVRGGQRARRDGAACNGAGCAAFARRGG